MLVKCINNGQVRFLTVDKIYEVIRDGEFFYRIKNDSGKEDLYQKQNLK